MSAVGRALSRQFGWPHGPLGALAGFVMAVRPSNRERGRRTLDRLAIRPGDAVLEIGFGPGVALAWAAEQAQAGIVIGIDRSAVMVAQAARRNAAAIASGRIRLYQASIDQPPAFDVRFDKVYAINVAMFWPDPLATLRTVARLMKPDATLALTFQPRQPQSPDRDAIRGGERLAQPMRDAGFADVRIDTIPIKPVQAVCVLGRAAR
jgi:SAM-dependent methyltransferase